MDHEGIKEGQVGLNEAKFSLQPSVLPAMLGLMGSR